MNSLERKNIGIFFDTSVLKVNSGKIDGFSGQFLNNKFISFWAFLDAHKLIEQYKLFVIQIVVDELKKQILIELDEAAKRARFILNILDSKYNDYDWDKDINGRLLIFIRSYNINIIPNDTSSETYNNIIERAINHEKPFSGEEKSTDKGFKDVVQWESIITYAQKTDIDKFIYVTGNTKDFTNNLIEEFSCRTNKEIIFSNLDNLQNHIIKDNDILSKKEKLRTIIENGLKNGNLIDNINIVLSSKTAESDPLSVIGFFGKMEHITAIIPHRKNLIFDLVEGTNDEYSCSLYVNVENNPPGVHYLYELVFKFEDNNIKILDVYNKYGSFPARF